MNERHLKSICRPFNRYDDKSANADIEVAFAWQSGHSVNAIASPSLNWSAFPDSLQPALLRLYKWASRQWHGFLRLDHSFEVDTSTNGPEYRKESQHKSKRPLERAEDSQVSKRLRPSFQMRSISPPPSEGIRFPQPSLTSICEDSDFTGRFFGIDRDNQSVENVEDYTGNRNGDDGADNACAQSPISSGSLQSDPCDSRPPDVISEAENDQAPPESYETGQYRSKRELAEAYGFRGSFLDLGDLIRCPALGIKHYGRMPTFVSCKDAMNALRRLPRDIRSKITEIGIPDELMAADDCDNLEYIKEFGQCLIEATVNTEVVTLSVPNDLTAGARGNEGQYEFRLWGLHEAVINAFKHGQFIELRFAHTENYSKASPTIDVYQMHNVDKYIKRMLVGESIDDALWTKSLRLIQSQRYPTPPSVIDNKDTLFAILHAIDYDAWITAGYAIAFTQPHVWEEGSILALRRSPLTVHTLSDDCKARRGCGRCAFPLAACDQWGQRDNSRRPFPSSQCRFGEIIYDVVVGLCQSECYFYREFLVLEMGLASDDDITDQELAVWLGSPMFGMDDVASQFIRIFLLWTRAAREQVSKRET